MTRAAIDWGGILLLGAWHGVNPGMGWLFAVALGMQERDGRAVWRALPPLALGHGVAIAVAVLTAAALGTMVSPTFMSRTVGALLIAFGLWKLTSPGHPRYGGMQVTRRELAIWSALMASAHGAGLMIVPFVIARGNEVPSMVAGHAAHMAGVVPGYGLDGALAATVVHTIGYLGVTAALAFLVYQRFGLARLRRMWINVDRLWAGALILAGVMTVPLA